MADNLEEDLVAAANIPFLMVPDPLTMFFASARFTPPEVLNLRKALYRFFWTMQQPPSPFAVPVLRDLVWNYRDWIFQIPVIFNWFLSVVTNWPYGMHYAPMSHDIEIQRIFLNIMKTLFRNMNNEQRDRLWDRRNELTVYENTRITVFLTVNQELVNGIRMDQFCQHARFTATDIIQHLNQTVNPDRTRMILLGNLQRRNGRQNPSLFARLPPENIRSITNRARIPDIQGPGTREEIIAYIHSIQFPDEVHGYL
jgi:hypothetical protein